MNGYNTYVGARYVPKFDGDWNNTKEYEPLVIVSYQGNSYTSKTFVPKLIAITDTKYWALTGNYNAQVEAYREEVRELKSNMEFYVDTVSELKSLTIGAGSTVQTGGYYELNDFGSASYIIRDEEPLGYYELLDNGQYAELIITDNMNVHQFGAKSDVIDFDSTTAFVNSLTYLKYAQLISGTYNITTLELEHDNSIYCSTPNKAGIKYLGDGIKIKGNNITLSNFSLYGGINGARNHVGLENIIESNNVVIDGLIFYYFTKCIDLSHYMYGLEVSNTLFINNDVMINIQNIGAGYNMYNINFDNCKELNCDVIGVVLNARVKFDNCILTVNKDEAFVTSSTSNVMFNKCFFEQEKKITSGHFIFYAYGTILFNDCSFTENCETNDTYWFTLPSTAINISLINCNISAYSEELKCAGLIYTTGSSGAPTGVLTLNHLKYYGAPAYLQFINLGSYRRLINDLDYFGIIISKATSTSLLLAGYKYSIFDSDGYLYQAWFDGDNLIPIDQLKRKSVSTAITTTANTLATVPFVPNLPTGATLVSFNLAFSDGTPEITRLWVDANRNINIETSTGGLTVVYVDIWYTI